ncbi:MAG: SpoIIE family protein phosphatase [Verrucomicrobia bacterium]|nr:SpoIIE family protein phosphatase [Verrucomicrobiota bacterium]
MVESIGEGVDRNELFRRVVHSAILSTGAMSACVFERSGNKLRGVAIEGLFPPHRPLPEHARQRISTRAKYLEQVLKAEVFDVGEGLVGNAALSGEGLFIEDARNDPRVIKHDDPALVVRSVIVVPISFRQYNIGVLAIVNPSDGLAFGETDFSLAKSLAEQAGLAIHNLDLMALQIEKNKLDLDLALASNVQGMLLPKEFPDSSKLDIAAVYLPAQKVGGDLYDVFALGQGRYGMAIADVSGKGIPASLLMAICQSNLRHLARQYPNPADVMRQLNSSMTREMRTDMFITVVYAVIDTCNHQLHLARAGHEMPLLVHTDPESGLSEAKLLAGEGMAIGMVDDEIFNTVITEITMPFTPGDLLVLYTDGVTEIANNEGIEFSNSRLADVIKAMRVQSATEVNGTILDKVTLFAGQESQLDDITLLTVRCRA